MRSYNEILTEATNTKNINVLSECWEEIVKNKYSYSIVQIEYAYEYLGYLARKMAKEHTKLIKQQIGYD